ncbi:phage holin family protein [Planosporangium sp. 12N6]|uniref:phage holin family protein n=1 Tax=Planosporangium spinosum TaxID=3402278 RepID=UPI003CF996E7
MTEPEAGRTEPRRTPERPVDRLSQDMADVARTELVKIRDEVVETARGAGTGVGLLLAAGACGALAVQSASIALLRALEANMRPGRAAATLTVAYLAAAATLAVFGIARLRMAGGHSEEVSREVRRVMPARLYRW